MNKSTTKISRSEIGRNIRRLRERQNMSQTQLAKILWIDRSSLSGYEIGKRVPDIFMLCKMADVFGVSLDTLVGREWSGKGKESDIEEMKPHKIKYIQNN